MESIVGAQIWALRNVMLNDPENTLKRLAEAGYSFIEPAGFNPKERTIQGFAPAALKKLAGSHGLAMHSGHFSFQPEDTYRVCDCAAELGMEYIVCPVLREEQKQTADTYKQTADELNEIGETVNKYGMRLAYHNHAYEFEPKEGIFPFDILLSNTEPDKVFFQMDIGWVVYSGQSPVAYFKKYPGRFPLWHIRDIDVHTHTTTIVGDGMVDFKTIFAQQETAGLQYAIVEMASGMEDPLGKITRSMRSVQNCRN